MAQRILLVEDEKNIGSTLTEYLQEHGYECVWVQNLSNAAAELKNGAFHLAILDVGLPDGSGFDLAKNIQSYYPATGILFLTAYTHPDDRIKGLSLGAEDYVMKPFNMTELLLRVKNALKRGDYRQEHTKQLITLGRASFDFNAHEAKTDGEGKKTARKVLVTLGGSDPENIMGFVAFSL